MSNWKPTYDKSNNSKIVMQTSQSMTVTSVRTIMSTTATVQTSTMHSSLGGSIQNRNPGVSTVPYRSTYNPPSLSSTSRPTACYKPSVPSSSSSSAKTTVKTGLDAVPFASSLSSGLNRVNTNYQSPYANQRASVFGSVSYGRAAGSSALNAPSRYQYAASNSNQNSAPPSGHVRSNSLGRVRQIDDFLSKVLKVKVKKTKTAVDLSRHKVPVYKTSSKRRGNVFIVNNVKFVGEANRKGAEVDEKNVSALFAQMGFAESRYKDLTVEQMRRKLLQFKDNRELAKVDVAVMVFMSHGHGTERSDSSEVVGVDGCCLPASWIIDQFSADNCPDLAGKPKIFIFQCCRGEKKDSSRNYSRVGVDGLPMNKNYRNHEDMLIAYSTIPGFVSHRDLSLGTWYIQAICKIFMEHACDTHVEDLFKLVDVELSTFISNQYSTQTSSYENRGFKICYLNPK